MIDKKSPVPLYLQLEKALRKKISSDLAPGEPLGTIEDICNTYRVSAITVKHSLFRLAADGIVKSIKSRGYFVKKTKCIENDAKIIAFVTFIPERSILNPMYANLFAGAYSVLKNNKVTLSLYSPEELILENEYKNSDFYGFILADVHNQSLHELLFSSNSKFILADIYSDIYPSILTDSQFGAESATEYLIGQGHSKIIFAKPFYKDENFNMRIDGYKKALKKNKIEIRDDLILDESKIPPDERIKAMKKMLTGKDSPTAIFFASDSQAHYYIPEIQKMGFRIPEDLSVIGFDDQEESYYMDPPLTTIKQPMFEVGRRAAQMLLDMKDERRSFFSQKPILIKPALIVRKSCAPPPII